MSIAVVLQQRFFDCILEVSPDQARIGVKRSSQQAAAASDKRTLLAVEQQAMQSRQAGVVAKQQFLEFTQAHLHDQVAEELFLKLSKFETVSNTVFNLADGFPAVLDALSAKAVTLSQLEALINPVDWLKEDLLKLANQPQYRKKVATSFVKELKVALGMFGIESLKQIIPLFAFKRCLPHSTDPFTRFKSNIWEYSMAVAMAAKRLAEESGDNAFVAFCTGLFQSLGYLVVTRTYLRTYAQVKQDALLKARDARDTELTNALDSLNADASFLTSCFAEFSAFISADLVSKWQLKRMPLGQTLDQLAEGIGFQGAGPLAKLVQQADYFAQAQWLKRNRQLSEAEDLLWRQQVQLRPEYLEILQNTRLDKVSLE
ncbi:MAG TPA: hypothetical protein DF774_17300 [Rheinheimera sp.]|uniref:HDOD domain-containing protein n=1 Tax=Rheinheimera sp. TaxID=1869214 RepID=UPI000EDEFCC2|nr:HDOD domain-containing protein [Rheinheimera sp.]HCU67508.1 hypothetical protein [Rheinheimera sp.]